MALNPDVLKAWPPGGWSFYEPSTDWHAPGPLQFTFTQQVSNIIKMRQANLSKHLSTDEGEVRAELERYTESRLAALYSRNGIKKFLLEQPEDKKKGSSFTAFNRPRNGGGAGLAGVARAAVGIGAKALGVDARSLEDWLGEGGKPVSEELATYRASICAPCRGNQKGDWQRLLTTQAASVIRGFLGHKHSMSLTTPWDAKLGVCVACKCCLALKVWCPIQHIRDSIERGVEAKLLNTNDKCWVLQELYKLRDDKRNRQVSTANP